MLRQIYLYLLTVTLGVIGVGIAAAETVPQDPLAPEGAPPTSGTAADLDPNPDPLFLPTKPEEVEIERTVPLTLAEAIALAQRNNRDFLISQLQLEAARAQLQVAEAALYPTLGLDANFRRGVSPEGELAAEARQRAAETQIPVLRATLPPLQQQIDFLSQSISQNVQLAEELLRQGAAPPPVDPELVPPEIIPLVQALQEQRQQLVELQSQQLQLQAQQQQQQLDQIQQAQQQQLGQLQQAAQELNAKNYASTALQGVLRLNYFVYSPERQANIDSAGEQVRFSELEVQRVGRDISRNVALAYYQLQRADQNVRIAQQDVETRRKQLEGIQLLLDAALATRLDLLDAQVELGNALQNLRNFESQQETARREVAALLSLPPSVTPVAADPVELAGDWKLSLAESIILGLKNRVELEQFLAQRRQNQAQAQAALGAIRPRVSLFAEYLPLRLWSDDPSNLTSRGFADGYAFGFNINWNFFDGGAASAQAESFATQSRIAEQQFARQANDIRIEVERAFFPLPKQLENVATATEALEFAREAVRAAQLRFQASVATNTDVLLAQNRLVQAEQNLVNAILTYNESLAELKRAVGIFPPVAGAVPEGQSQE